jgi:hypothetical protein
MLVHLILLLVSKKLASCPTLASTIPVGSKSQQVFDGLFDFIVDNT